MAVRQRAEEAGRVGVRFVLFCFDVVGEFQMEKFYFPGKARSFIQFDVSLVFRRPTIRVYLC